MLQLALPLMPTSFKGLDSRLTHEIRSKKMTRLVNVGCSDGKKASRCYFESNGTVTCVKIRFTQLHMTKYF